MEQSVFRDPASDDTLMHRRTIDVSWDDILNSPSRSGRPEFLPSSEGDPVARPPPVDKLRRMLLAPRGASFGAHEPAPLRDAAPAPQLDQHDMVPRSALEALISQLCSSCSNIIRHHDLSFEFPAHARVGPTDPLELLATAGVGHQSSGHGASHAYMQHDSWNVSSSDMDIFSDRRETSPCRTVPITGEGPTPSQTAGQRTDTDSEIPSDDDAAAKGREASVALRALPKPLGSMPRSMPSSTDGHSQGKKRRLADEGDGTLKWIEQDYNLIRSRGRPRKRTTLEDFATPMNPEGIRANEVPPRSADDIYTPLFVRKSRGDKEARCEHCGEWFRMRSSNYWHHLHLVHGISSSGKLIPPPRITGENNTRKEGLGLCGCCRKWVVINPPTKWYRHYISCEKPTSRDQAQSEPEAIKMESHSFA